MKFSILLAAICCFSTTLFAQTSQPSTDNDASSAIATLRRELIDSFNKGDLPRLLSHLDPDVVVTWQNGEVCRGREAVKAYYDKMMTGPERRVQSIKADPQVEDRHVYGDYAVSWGSMNDEFVMADGTSLRLDSRFTATIARRGTEWEVTGFHVSGNLFDNPVLHYAMKKVATMTGVIAGGAGLLVGLLIGRMSKRSRAAAKPA